MSSGIERVRKADTEGFTRNDLVSFGLLVALVLVVIAPVVFRGHVLVPGNLYRELGEGDVGSEYPTFSRMSDIHRYFIPKLSLQFQGDHESWNATWNPHIQLGKPASHFGGYSKAYPLTYILSYITRDPYRLHALIGVATLALLTLVTYLFLRALDLLPGAAFIGAVGVGLTTRSIFWIGFSQFLAWGLWSLAILWLVARWMKRRRWVVGWGLVLCAYCLAIGARHQATLRISVLVIPAVLATIFLAEQRPRKRVSRVVQLAFVPLLAGTLAFPLLHDLSVSLDASLRMASDTTEFIKMSRAPVLDETLPSLWHTFSFGNPSRSEYPMTSTGMDFNPFFAGLLAISFVVGLPPQARVFRGVFLLFLSLVLFEPVHAFAVEHLGLGFSRGNPTGGLYIPGFVLCAFAADRLLRSPSSDLGVRLRSLSAVVAVTIGGVGLVLRTPAAEHLQPAFLALGLVLAGLAAAFTWWRSVWILHLAGVVVAVVLCSSAMVHRPRTEILEESPLLEALTEATAGGYRFARLGSVPVLPSNLEVLADLRSIHSYDSLAPRSYDRWARTTMEEGTRVFGRHFDSFGDLGVLQKDTFSYTGTRALLTHRSVDLEGWRTSELPAGYSLLVAEEPPRLVARIGDYEIVEGGAVVAGRLEPRSLPDGLRVTLQRDDHLRLALSPAQRETLVFVSRQFHRDWSAEGDGRRLETLPVNDFYLGVLVPGSISEIDLRFLPWARWAWLPLVFFAVSLVPAMLADSSRERESCEEGVGAK